MSKNDLESAVGMVGIWKQEPRAAVLVLLAVIAAFAWLGIGCGKREPSASQGQAGAAQPAALLAVLLEGARAGAERTVILNGGVKLSLCGIPAGTFIMGSLDSEQDCGDDETQHRVTLTKAFWLGRTTVTQAQWRAVMESNPSHIKGEDLPVECVSWDDATEFCGKLNGEGLISSGWKFALPTEAQWEFACRAGTTGPYGGDLDKMSWHFGNSGGMTRPVETKIPNAWGLYDLHGNVAQWCADWYEEYPAGSVTDPTGPSTGSYRVFRGGSGILVGGNERSAYRIRSEPGSPNNGMGFRVAAVPAERGQAGAVAGIAATGTGARDERVAKSAAPVKVSLEGARVGTERTIVLSGTVKLSLCVIPAGTFTMGSPASEANRSNNETQHRVTLTKAFWLGRTDVTQAQWRAVMGNSPSYFKGDNLPVEQVSWNDSKEFCGKLNGKGLISTGWKFALPTEAQWEYACRVGTTGAYAGNLDEMAWYSGNSDNGRHPVATKRPNAWGLYDMHGNVWQWCADWDGDYPSDAVTDPTGPSSGTFRVVRGGCWGVVGGDCRSASRSGGEPSTRSCTVGFRVAALPSR